tara:strand:+ start:2376 stop:2519 length:144 start_codon:yes stop_codon:yes gene_type:complete
METMEICRYCQSEEVTHNQLIMDSYCADCGKWQEGKQTIKQKNYGSK